MTELGAEADRGGVTVSIAELGSNTGAAAGGPVPKLMSGAQVPGASH